MIKKTVTKSKPEPKAKTVPAKKAKVKDKKPKMPVELTAKELATKNGEPYVTVLSMELDPKDVNNGAFELDWNDKFILDLIRAGYKAKPEDKDTDLVDRWFQTVCRNIALEVYEQNQADPDNRTMRVIKSKDLGNGRTEVS